MTAQTAHLEDRPRRDEVGPVGAAARPEPAREPVRVLMVLAGAVLRGAETHTLRLAQKLPEHGFQVELAMLYDWEVAREARALGIGTHVAAKAFRGDLRVVTQIARIAKTGHFRIVHTHLVNGNFYGRLAAALCPGVRVVSTIHNYWDALMFFRTRAAKRLVYRVDIAMARLSDRVIAVTDDLRRSLVADGMGASRVVTIRNGVDTEEFAPGLHDGAAVRAELGIPAGAFLVGSAGRLVPQKHFDDFLRVVGRLRDQGLDAWGLVLGEGASRPALEALAGELGIREAVRMPGFRGDLARVMSALDAFALCSDTETTSLVTLQAMSLSKPVVVTSVGSLPEVLTGSGAGHLVPLGAVEETAGHLGTIAADPSGAAEMGRKGRAWVQSSYSERVQMEQTAAIYRGVLGRC